jgi:lysyl-tRNA synthetase, class II
MAKEQSSLEKEQLKKIDQLKSLKINLFIDEFKVNYNSSKLKKNFDFYSREELEKKEFSILFSLAGRICSKRRHGKLFFLDVQDQEGIFQVSCKKNKLPLKEFSLLKFVDSGDIFGFKGYPIKTKAKNQLTLEVVNLKLLTKCVKTLPSEFYGLENIEKRYRKRYLDLILNQDVKKKFLLRSKIISFIRNFLNKQGYLEVETPVLQSIAGGGSAKPFITYFNSLKQNFYLRIATELHLKQLLIGGFEKIYEIGRLFRNEGISYKHNPEFTSIEIYTAYKNLNFLFNFIEKLFLSILKMIKKDKNLEIFNQESDFKLNYQGLILDFKPHWKRIHIVDLIKEKLNIDFWKINDLNAVKLLAIEQGLFNSLNEIPKYYNSIGHFINLFFEKKIENDLIQPIFVYGHPFEVSPLAKRNEKDGRWSERFELFINGCEIANAFSENTDPFYQLQTFQKQAEEKKYGNEEMQDIDFSFIEALEHGMPPAAGIGIGIDRLIMLFTNSKTIKEIILFPQLKSKN